MLFTSRLGSFVSNIVSQAVSQQLKELTSSNSNVSGTARKRQRSEAFYMDSERPRAPTSEIEFLTSRIVPDVSDIVSQAVSEWMIESTSSNSNVSRSMVDIPHSSSDEVVMAARKGQRLYSSDSDLPRAEALYMDSERPRAPTSEMELLTSRLGSVVSNIVSIAVSQRLKELTSSNSNVSGSMVDIPHSSSDEVVMDDIDFEPARKRRRLYSSDSHVPRSEASYMDSEMEFLTSRIESDVSNIVSQSVSQWMKEMTFSISNVSGSMVDIPHSSSDEVVMDHVDFEPARKRQRLYSSDLYLPRSEALYMDSEGPRAPTSEMEFLKSRLVSVVSNIVSQAVSEWMIEWTSSNSNVSGSMVDIPHSSSDEVVMDDIDFEPARKRQRLYSSEALYMDSEHPHAPISEMEFFASPFKSFTSNVVPQTVSKGTKRLISSNSSASRLIYPPDSSSDDEIIGIDLEPPRKRQRFGSLNTNESRSEVSCMDSECPHSANSQTDKNNLQEGVNIKRKEDQMQSEVSKGVQKDDLSEKEIDGNDREPLFFGNKESLDVNLASNMNCANIKRGGTLNSQKMKLAEARRLGRLERIRKYSVRITRLKKKINELSDSTASKNVLVFVYDPVHLGKSSAALEIDESQDKDHTSPQASSSLNDI